MKERLKILLFFIFNSAVPGSDVGSDLVTCIYLYQVQCFLSLTQPFRNVDFYGKKQYIVSLPGEPYEMGRLDGLRDVEPLHHPPPILLCPLCEGI